MMNLSRRSLITGLVSLAVTAPAIVRASSLMPVKDWREGFELLASYRISLESTAKGFRNSPFYQLYDVSRPFKAPFTLAGCDIVFDGGWEGVK